MRVADRGGVALSARRFSIHDTHTHVCIRVCLKGVKRKVPSVSLKDIHNIQAHTWVGGRCVEGVAPLRSAVRKVTSPPALRLCAAAAAAPTHSTDTRLGGRARPAEQCTGAPLPRAPDSLHSRLRLRPASGTPRDLGKGSNDACSRRRVL